MGKSDALMYSASTEVSDTDDNHDQIVLVSWQLHHIMSTIITGPNPVKERICECSEKKAKVISTLKQMKKTGPCKLANGAAE